MQICMHRFSRAMASIALEKRIIDEWARARYNRDNA